MEQEKLGNEDYVQDFIILENLGENMGYRYKRHKETIRLLIVCVINI